MVLRVVFAILLLDATPRLCTLGYRMRLPVAIQLNRFPSKPAPGALAPGIALL